MLKNGEPLFYLYTLFGLKTLGGNPLFIYNVARKTLEPVSRGLVYLFIDYERNT